MFKIKKINDTYSERRKIIELYNIIYCDFFKNHKDEWFNNLFVKQLKSSLMSKFDIKIYYKKKIIGFYIFQTSQYWQVINSSNKVCLKENLELYRNKKGIEGFVLGILPEYRKMGAAITLINYVKKEYSKEFDYLWGSAYKNLNNIDFWLKSRRIVAESEDSYYTLMDLK